MSRNSPNYNVLYIPNISIHDRWLFDSDVFQLFEVNIGHVERMDIVNVEYIRGQKRVSVYIKLAYWRKNIYTEYLRRALEVNYAKLYYDGPYYWLIYKNAIHVFPTKSTDTLEMLEHRKGEGNYPIFRFQNKFTPLEPILHNEIVRLENIELEFEDDENTSSSSEEEIMSATNVNAYNTFLDSLPEEVINSDIHECRKICKQPLFISTLYLQDKV
jgi:hypothetical protein